MNNLTVLKGSSKTLRVLAAEAHPHKRIEWLRGQNPGLNHIPGENTGNRNSIEGKEKNNDSPKTSRMHTTGLLFPTPHHPIIPTIHPCKLKHS